MAEPHIITTLRSKRLEIEAAISYYEKKAETAKRDLFAVDATLSLFERTGEPLEFPAYVHLGRF